MQVAIKSIKRVSKQIGYDLSVENNNNYFANNILVHNCSIYSDYFHARSIDARPHPSQSWIRQFAANIGGNIPQDWRICGENLWALHSIFYDNLETYFYGFSVWNDRNECLSWDDTLEWFELLDITPVPTLYRGIYDEKLIKGLWNEITKNSSQAHEGYIIRLTSSFMYKDFRKCLGKFVRANHIQNSTHWSRLNTQIVKNLLKKR